MNELIVGIIGAVTTIVSGFVSWFFTRRKYNSEVDNAVITNMKESLDFYIKLSDDNKERLEEALRRNEKLENDIRELRQQMFDMMTAVCYDMSCELRKKQIKAKIPTKQKDK